MIDEEETDNEENQNKPSEKENIEKKFTVIRKQLTYYIVGGIGLFLVGIGIYVSPLPSMVSSLIFHKSTKQDLSELAFLPIPEMIVNLKSSKSRGNILKAAFFLEIESIHEKEKIDHLRPIIIDQFQSYLRELEINDIQGAAGIERVRQELFNRVNALITPLKIRQILIRDFLVQ